MKRTTHGWRYNRMLMVGCWAVILLLAFFHHVEQNTKADDEDIAPQASRVSREVLFGVTTDNMLVTFNSDTPGTFLSTRPITGLQSGEMVLGIDFRPATGQLFALGSTSRLYTLNPATGAATAVATAPFTPALTGTEFGFDFNPTVDRIRLVSNNTQDLRLNPATGTVAATDGMLAFAATDPNAGKTPNVVAAAYTNNFAGSTTTTLYDIDSNLDILTIQNPPNNGTLVTVGTLGVNASDIAGFDISDVSGIAYASFVIPGDTTSKLYRINLATGAATLIGNSAAMLRGFAVGARGEQAIALTASNRLLTFNTNQPGTILNNVAVTGLQAGENLVGIDFRPANGVLYGVGSTSRIYIINPLTGVATQVGTVPFTPALSGTDFGVDFNPQPDRIRLTSNTGQDLRLNQITGTVAAVDGTLAYDTADANAGRTPTIVASAYVNNFAGTPTTTLYDIDSNLDILVTQGSLNSAPVSPNSGTLFTVGPLNIDISTVAGFDISAQTNAAFGAFNLTGETNMTKLYTLNLTTGATTLLGVIGGGETVRDIAIVNQVEIVTALTVNNNLVTFNRRAPGALLSGPTPITGLQGGETVVGIDFRPATGQLIGIGSTSRVYSINPSTGVATQIGTGQFTPNLSGTVFGVDFNPTVDRIRLVSNNTQDLRLNPNNGAVAATDGNLAYATTDTNAGKTPNVVSVAYTNNFTGSTTTTLYDIDSALDVLTIQNPPNNGTLVTVGPLGIDATDNTGFDITEATNVALLSTTLSGETMSKLYTLDLSTGTATLVGTIGGTELIRDIAVGTNAAADVAVAVAANPTTVLAGANITYTATVTNAGPDPSTNVVLTTATPANTTFVSLTAPTGFTCTTPAAGATGAITCTGALLASGASAAFQIVVQSGTNVTNGAMATLMVMVSSSTPEGNAVAGNNTAMASATINLPGPTVTNIKFNNSSKTLTANITGQTEPVTVLVNNVAFANPAKIKNGKLKQKGSLTDGTKINQALPKGQAVQLSFRNANGGVTTVSFTR